MRKIIRNTGVILTAVALSMSFTASAADFETWYVNARSGLNLRTEPTTRSSVITAYPKHTELKVIGTDGGKWWQVYDGARQGWVYSEYMSESTDEAKTKSKTNSKTKAKTSENDGDIGDCIGTFYITGYTSSPSENGGYSVDCFGQALEPQIGEIIAVDPNVIPLGSTVYIEGVGYRTARDTGGAIKGNRIDVLTGSNSESYAVTGDKKVYMVK